MAAIALPVKELGRLSDRALGHNLTNKDDAPPVGDAFAPADIKAKVHFFEMGVKRNRKNSEEPCAKKVETDKTQECPALVRVGFGSPRDIRA
jgi:hypothetical protein